MLGLINNRTLEIKLLYICVEIENLESLPCLTNVRQFKQQSASSFKGMMSNERVSQASALVSESFELEIESSNGCNVSLAMIEEQ